MTRFRFHPSLAITLSLIVIIIPLTVAAVHYQTSLSSKATEVTPAPPPSFKPTPVMFPPHIIPFDFPQMYTLSSYKIPVVARDADIDDILQLTATGLPAGLTLSQCQYPTNLPQSDSLITCAIIGSPTQAGTFSITLTVFDKMGNLGQITRPLQVKNWYSKLLFQ